MTNLSQLNHVWRESFLLFPNFVCRLNCNHENRFDSSGIQMENEKKEESEWLRLNTSWFCSTFSYIRRRGRSKTHCQFWFTFSTLPKLVSIDIRIPLCYCHCQFDSCPMLDYAWSIFLFDPLQVHKEIRQVSNRCDNIFICRTNVVVSSCQLKILKAIKPCISHFFGAMYLWDWHWNRHFMALLTPNIIEFIIVVGGVSFKKSPDS